VLPPGLGTGPHYPALRIAGAYVLSQGRPIGFIKQMLDDPNVEDRSSGLRVISVVRSE
jgi:hypothetical protein